MPGRDRKNSGVVKSEAEIQRIVDAFVERLAQEAGIKVSKVILYGSYVRGDAHRWSDIDIAVVSDDFKGLSQERRMNLVWDIGRRCHLDLSPRAYTLREYQRASPISFLGEIKRTGKVVYEAG